MQITLGQFIDNMEQNGYPQITGELFEKNYTSDWEYDITQGGCALGQACYNTTKDYSLSADSDSGEFWDQLNSILGSTGQVFDSWVIDKNDRLQWPIKDIAEQARIVFADQLDTIITIDA